jgi:hypothetical protein
VDTFPELPHNVSNRLIYSSEELMLECVQNFWKHMGNYLFTILLLDKQLDLFKIRITSPIKEVKGKHLLFENVANILLKM